MIQSDLLSSQSLLLEYHFKIDDIPNFGGHKLLVFLQKLSMLLTNNNVNVFD